MVKQRRGGFARQAPPQSTGPGWVSARARVRARALAAGGFSRPVCRLLSPRARRDEKWEILTRPIRTWRNSRRGPGRGGSLTTTTPAMRRRDTASRSGVTGECSTTRARPVDGQESSCGSCRTANQGGGRPAVVSSSQRSFTVAQAFECRKYCQSQQVVMPPGLLMLLLFLLLLLLLLLLLPRRSHRQLIPSSGWFSRHQTMQVPPTRRFAAGKRSSVRPGRLLPPAPSG